jgi:hypothetical protein
LSFTFSEQCQTMVNQVEVLSTNFLTAYPQ